MGRSSEDLRSSVPAMARIFFRDTGPFSDKRREEALNRLLYDKNLDDLLATVDRSNCSYEAWATFICGVLDAVECIPIDGRATADRPDEKLAIRARQLEATRRIERASRAAQALADELRDLESMAAEVPAEFYSGVALLRASVEDGPNHLARQFLTFARGLSSRERADLPSPADMLDALALRGERWPAANERFSDDAWLVSQKSSWRDFLRMVHESLESIGAVYGAHIRFREKHWVALVQALVAPSATRSDVSNALRTLTTFSDQPAEK